MRRFGLQLSGDVCLLLACCISHAESKLQRVCCKRAQSNVSKALHITGKAEMRVTTLHVSVAGTVGAASLDDGWTHSVGKAEDHCGRLRGSVDEGAVGCKQSLIIAVSARHSSG